MASGSAVGGLDNALGFSRRDQARLWMRARLPENAALRAGGRHSARQQRPLETSLVEQLIITNEFATAATWEASRLFQTTRHGASSAVTAVTNSPMVGLTQLVSATGNGSIATSDVKTVSSMLGKASR
jgi:hypothetical protein